MLRNQLFLALLGLVIAGCEPAPTCTDGKKNGAETDVDCGGSCATRCADGRACGAGADCESGICTAGLCAAPSCTDRVKNGSEADVDCGGTCGKCANQRSCRGPGDCQSGICTASTCVAPSCTDGAKNGSEADVDCGGPQCMKCGEGKSCGGDSDCASDACDGARCVPSPALMSIQPRLGPIAGGTDITLTGQNFRNRPGLQVLVGGVPATMVSVMSSTEIKARTGATTKPAEADVEVVLSANKKLSLAKGFRYYWGTVGLASPTSTPLPGLSAGLALADFNGDGNIDAATANHAVNNISVLTGKGDGTFNPPVNYPVAGNPARIVATDLNGDNKLDLAVTSFNGGFVAVLTNKGDGTFSAPVSYTGGAGTDDLAGLVAADFNGDMKMDLASAHRAGGSNLIVWLGKGDGTLMNAVKYPAAAGALDVVSGDFDGDKQPDLAISYLSTAAVGVFINKGDGTGTFKARVDYPAPNDTYTLAAADFNGDSKLDLAATTGSGNMLTVLPGKGDGTFDAAKSTNLGTGQVGLGWADINQDGRADLVVVRSGTLQLLLGNGDGTFQAPINRAVGTESSQVVVIFDLNKDGKLDVLTTGDGKLMVTAGTAM